MLTEPGGGDPICLRKVSGSGMPGVGVAPGFKGLPSIFGSGMPGVGVAPFGRTLAALAGGIPGVEFADGGIGEADNPGGRLFASRVVGPPKLVLLFAPAFELVVVAAWQPAIVIEIEAASKRDTDLLIDKIPRIFKMAVPARRLRPLGEATAFEPARAGIKRNSEGSAAAIGKQLQCDYRRLGPLVNTIFAHF